MEYDERFGKAIQIFFKELVRLLQLLKVRKMKKYFIEECHHYKSWDIASLIYSFALLVVFGVCVFDNSDGAEAVWYIFLGVFLVIVPSRMITERIGIYIINDRLYSNKLLKKKEIDINSIKAMRIIKSEEIVRSWATRAGSFKYVDLKDRNGSQLQSIILLKETAPGMSEYENGDLRFCRKYKKSVIAMCRYDIKFIEFLRKMNPSIEVL